MDKKLSLEEYQKRVSEIGQILLDVVASVSLGDMNVEINIPDDIDIFADLGVGLQFMIEDLRDLSKNQEVAREELEQRVSMRTRELERAMRELQNTQNSLLQENWQKYIEQGGEDGETPLLGLKRMPEGEEPANPKDWLPGMDQALTLGRTATNGNGGSAQTLSLPIKLQDEVIGVVGFNRENGQPWEAEEVNTVEQIIEQVGLALENQRLFDQTQTALAETDTLYNASAELNTAQTYADILQVFEKYTTVGQRAERLAICLFNETWTSEDRPDMVEILAAISPDSANQILELDRVPLFPAADTLLTPSEYTFIANVEADTRVTPRLEVHFKETEYARAAAYFPMVVAGRWVGYISALYQDPTTFRENALRRAMVITTQASVAVQNLRSLDLAETRAEEAQRRSDELALVNRIVSTVAASFDLNVAMDFVAKELRQAVPKIDETGIALLNVSGTQLEVVADAFRDPETKSAVGQIIPVKGNRSTEQVINSKKPTVVRNVQSNPDTEMIHDVMHERAYDTMVIFPLVAGNDVIGTVATAFYDAKQTEGLTADEMRLIETILLQASTAIQNTRLFEQTQSALTETTSLYQANAELNAVQSTQDVLDILRRYTVLGNDAHLITITLFDEPWIGEEPPVSSQRVAGWSRDEQFDLDAVTTPLMQYPHASTMMPRNDLKLVNDFDEYPGLKPAIDANFPPDIFNVQALLVIPLRVAGATIGETSALFNQPLDLSDDQQRRMMALAGQSAVALQNIRLFEETQKRASQLQTAAEIARESSGTLELGELLDRAVNLITERFDYYHAGIFLLEGSNAVVKASTGEAGRQMVLDNYALPMAEGRSIIGTVTYSGEAMVINDVTSDPEHRPHDLLPETRSELGIPLKIGNRVTGALDVQSNRPNAFTEDDIAVLQILADQIAVAVDNARSFEVAQQAVEEMREIDRVKSEFLANMSHELRTPLNSIIGFSRVILKGIDGPINDLQKQDLDAIHNSGQHLLDMINDILDLSRIEAGKMDLSIEELDIKETIDSVMSTVKGLIKEKPVRIINNSPENLPMVSADRTRARQILINMFSNAVKFTDEGTITLDVTIEQEPHPQIRLVVTDTGIGISQEDQDKLFVRFSQVDSSPTRKAGGTGLGLNISRSLVELMGGEMGVNSELGQGSTFYFTLPIVGSVSSTPDQQIGGRLIISIEDDEKVVDLYRKYLRPHGFRVVGITEPDHVLAQVLSMMPYAVTIDPLMAKGKGWDLLGQLTNNPVTRNIPILVCSILEEHEKAESLGARDYILKPMREEHLVNAVLRLSQEKGISRQRILVVDDDPNVMHLVEKATRRQRQMELEYAQGGQKGLEALHDHRPDAVILDLFMPDMDGFSFLETLHKDPDMKSIPVVVLTGAELTESEKRRLEKYRRHLLFKGSFKADELITSIQRAIEDNISS